jgi:carbonic anhydrase
MPVTDELLENNERYAAGFTKRALPRMPAKGIAVLACMDARLDPARALGLEEGDAHVIRNAGGVVTDDAIRSLMISQRLLRTTEILLIQHTDCGMQSITDEDLKERIRQETGHQPPFELGVFSDLDEHVLESIARLQASPFIAHKDAIRGFVYDVTSGRLREVARVSPASETP